MVATPLTLLLALLLALTFSPVHWLEASVGVQLNLIGALYQNLFFSKKLNANALHQTENYVQRHAAAFAAVNIHGTTARLRSAVEQRFLIETIPFVYSFTTASDMNRFVNTANFSQNIPVQKDTFHAPYQVLKTIFA